MAAAIKSTPVLRAEGKMKKTGIVIGALSALACGCAMLQPQSAVEVYYRSDLDTQTGKVIVFPLLSSDGRKAEGAQNVELSMLGKWADMYGKTNIIPAGPVLEQLAGNDGFQEFIKALDNTSAVEQTHQNPRIREVVSAITGKLGNYNLALAIIDGGPQEFNAGKEIRLSIGFFDSRNMTWKWITKTGARKGKLGRWEMASSNMVNSSFKEIETKNK